MNERIEQTIREYLPDIVHLSLATSRDNRPWVCEVHFVYDDDLNLYFRSLRSRRHSQEIADNPQVAGNIVRQHSVETYPLGVYFEGTAEILSTDAQRRGVLELMKERLKVDEAVLIEANDPNGHQFYKISVSTWYVFGKLDGEKGQKYTLAWNGGEHDTATSE